MGFLNQYPANTSLSANVHKLVELATAASVHSKQSLNKFGFVISDFKTNAETKLNSPKTQPFFLTLSSSSLYKVEFRKMLSLQLSL